MIYVPIIVRSIHWILRVVYLSARHMYIYDSLRSLSKPNQLKNLITSLTILLSHLLNIVKYYGENGDLKGDMTWEIEVLNSVPQQSME